ncbi:MAG TPA: arginyltransferase [Gemmataceae bacterium]|nr:arginyltransferase [Gemmataceae bacterium]
MESLFTFVSPPGRCGYLPDRVWQLHYEVVGQITAAEYMDRLRRGWRRFGYSMFRPQCPSCRMCQPLRVPLATFRPDRSQRRAWKANHGEVRITVGSPSVSPTKLDLYDKFHQFQHEAKGWPSHDGEAIADYIESFVDNPFPTQEWCYHLGERLVGVGYVDQLPEGLSAIYFYHDPDERSRSLGTFNVLSVLAAAREQGLPHVYLGYYVEGCRSLEYKGRFRPNEVLRPDGTWGPFLD